MERERVAKLLYETWHHAAENRSRWDAMADAVLPLLADTRRQAVEECVAAIPTTWLDPLLSGPQSTLAAATAGQWGCSDIERLLRGLTAKIQSLLPPAPRREGEA